MERNKATMERNILPRVKDYEEDSSSSSMSLYSLDLNGEDLEFLSNWTPIVVLYNAPLPMHVEEVHSSPITEKVSSQRHYVVQEEDHPSSYILKKYLVLSISTFVERKSVKIELGK
jgi:hypothetical protein